MFDFEAQRSWVHQSSDDEIRKFVQTMESSDVAAQQAAIAGAWKKVNALMDRQDSAGSTSEPK